MKSSRFNGKLVAGAIGLISVVVVPSAVASDMHDYSSYIRLRTSTTCTGGWPAADKWNPAGEMTDTEYYLIPPGVTLSSNPTDSSKGGVWPCKELAIQGTLAIAPSGARGNCPTITNLALCAGGKISLNSAFSSLNGDTLDIRGTVANPSLIQCALSYNGSSDWRYPQLNMDFSGDEDSAVRFNYSPSGVNTEDFQRAFRVSKGFAHFQGTVIVDGARTWLRPETTATTFDIGGTLWVTNGASVYVATMSPTFGSLVLASDATLQLAANKTVTVTNSISIAEGAKITVNSITSTAYVTDNGSNSPPEIPVLSVCGAANAAAVDRGALLLALTSGGVFKNSVAGGMPRLVLVESARADGGVDFKVSHAPIVKQIKSCEAGKGPYGDGLYADYLSDGNEISSEKDYYDPGYIIYFKSPYEFPGRSLSLGGMVGFYNNTSFTVADLRLLDGAWFRQMKKDCTVHLKGAATLYGAPNFRVNGSGMFIVDSALAGTGDLIVALDVAKCRTEGSAYLGTLSLEGDNSAWSGRALVGCGRESTADIGLSNLTLRVTSATGLGGVVGTFTFDAVKVADTCKLAVTDTATFNAANRGWCFMDGATVDVADGKVATVGEIITFGGASVKSGNGTLILGGAAKFYDDENDEATDTPSGESFRIAAGTLGVASTNALDGVAVTFVAGTTLKIDPNAADADMLRYGAVNVKSAAPFTVEGGGAVPVAFAPVSDPDSRPTSFDVAICTVSSFAASGLAFAQQGRCPNYNVAIVTHQNSDGTVTYFGHFTHKGFIISVY